MNSNNKGVFRRIFRLSGKGGVIKLAFMVLLVIVQALSIAIGPAILGDALNIIVEGALNIEAARGGVDTPALIRVIIILCVLYIVGYLAKIVQEYMMSDFTANVVCNMRIRIANKMGRLPVGYYEKRALGDIMSTVTNDVDVIATGLQTIVSGLIYSVVLIVTILAIMLSLNLIMAGVVLLTLPISIFSMKGIVKRTGRAFYEQQVLTGEINGKIEEDISGFQVLKAYVREEDVIAEFDKSNEHLCKENSKSQFMGSMIDPIAMLIGNIGYIAVVIVGALLAIQGHLSVGSIQAFINYVNNFNQPVQNAAKMSTQIQMVVAATKRVFSFLDEEEEVVKDNLVREHEINGKVSFEDISFGYNPEKTIINDFSLEVCEGKQVAIVGPTGAGKSTIIKLLMRFYDVDSGRIMVDGMDIRELDRGLLRSGIGMVLQETWLFKGSILENIRFGRLDATREEVIEAAKLAEVDYFISTLPGGYDYELSEDGQNISSGQRQLITIARAILSNRPILILDEATSSVDTQTEHRIQRAMDNLMEGRTSFVIAHRLSTIRNADVILVLKDGDIVEQGTHSELLAKKGFYSELHNAQFEN
ncbi:MAG: ABC transporter ATP-binding protein [Lachnospiraceae bacterium]|nr:ABC transporter ATP-binding protein [Candidatus Merdinaster equi]